MPGTLGQMVVAILGDTSQFDAAISSSEKKFNALSQEITRSCVSIAQSFKNIEGEAAVWGRSTDLIAQKQQVLKNEISRLIVEGVDPLDRSIEKLQKEYFALGKESEALAKSQISLQSKLGAIGQTMTQVGIGMTLGITAPLVAMGVAAVHSTATMEMLQASFTTMLGSAEKATVLMNGLKKMAAITPFETTDLAQATKTLLQFGITNEKVIPTLQMLGDAAGGSSAKMGSMALVFGQITSMGRLMGQDLLQLINAGFNPLQEMAKSTGKSMAVLKDEMSKGRISAEMVAEAFKTATSEGGRFYKGMDTASKTFEGLVSTLNDDVATMGRSFVEGFMPALKDGVKWLSALAQGFATLDKGTKNVILGVAAVIAIAGPLIAAIGGVMTALSLMTPAMFALMGPIALVVAGVTALIVAIVAIGNAAKEARLDDVEKRFKGIGDAAGVTKENLLILEERLKDVAMAEKFLDESPFESEAINIKRMSDAMADIATKTGLTEDKVLALALASNKVTDAQKETLIKAKEYNESIKISFELEGRRSISEEERLAILKKQAAEAKYMLLIEKQRAGISVIDEIRAMDAAKAAEIAAANAALALAKKIAAEALLTAAEKERRALQAKALAEYNSAVAVKDAKFNLKTISAIEAQEELLSITNKYIAALFETGDVGSKTLIDQILIAKNLSTEIEKTKKATEGLGEAQKDNAAEMEKYAKSRLDFASKDLSAYDQEYLAILSQGEALVEAGIAEVDAANWVAGELAKLDENEKQSAAEKEAYKNELLGKGLNDFEQIEKQRAALVKDKILTEVEAEKWAAKEKLKVQVGYANLVVSTISDMMATINSLMDMNTQNQLDALQQQTDNLLWENDKQLQAALEAAGFQDKIAVESAQLKLDEAVKSGDAIAIKEATDALTKEKILADFAAKEKAINQQAAKDKYDLELSAFNTNQAFSIAQTIISTAQMAVEAFKSLAGISVIGPALGAAAAALASGFGVAKIAMIKAQVPPSPPKFAEGGIVMPTGGTLGILAEKTQPEVIFPLDQLEKFLGGANTSTGTGGMTHLVVNLDSRPLLDKIFNATKNRTVLISAGAVV